MTETGGTGSHPAPRSLDELWALRTDFEDVPVEELGGTVLRVYALSGFARAALFSEMAEMAESVEKGDMSPAVVQATMTFQGRVVASSLGYPREAWDEVGAVLGQGAVERLYEVAARLSGLGERSVARATARLPRTRKVATGTD